MLANPEEKIALKKTTEYVLEMLEKKVLAMEAEITNIRNDQDSSMRFYNEQISELHHQKHLALIQGAHQAELIHFPQKIYEAAEKGNVATINLLLNTDNDLSGIVLLLIASKIETRRYNNLRVRGAIILFEELKSDVKKYTLELETIVRSEDYSTSAVESHKFENQLTLLKIIDKKSLYKRLSIGLRQLIVLWRDDRLIEGNVKSYLDKYALFILDRRYRENKFTNYMSDQMKQTLDMIKVGQYDGWLANKLSLECINLIDDNICSHILKSWKLHKIEYSLHVVFLEIQQKILHQCFLNSVRQFLADDVAIENKILHDSFLKLPEAASAKMSKLLSIYLRENILVKVINNMQENFKNGLLSDTQSKKLLSKIINEEICIVGKNSPAMTSKQVKRKSLENIIVKWSMNELEQSVRDYISEILQNIFTSCPVPEECENHLKKSTIYEFIVEFKKEGQSAKQYYFIFSEIREALRKMVPNAEQETAALKVLLQSWKRNSINDEIPEGETSNNGLFYLNFRSVLPGWIKSYLSLYRSLKTKQYKLSAGTSIEVNDKDEDNDFKPEYINIQSSKLPSSSISINEQDITTSLTPLLCASLSKGVLQNKSDPPKSDKSSSTSYKSPETNLLEKGKQIEGLIFQQIDGDGHCLYNAICLHIGEDQAQLRKIVVEHLTKNMGQFRDFITIATGKSIDEFLHSIKQGHEWADNIEIEVIMRVLNRSIVIIGPDGKIRNPDDIQRFNGDPIFVFYNGHNHYHAYLYGSGHSPKDVLNNMVSSNMFIPKKR